MEYSLDAYILENQKIEIKFNDNKKRYHISESLCDIVIEQQQNYQLEINFCSESGRFSVKTNEKNAFSTDQLFANASIKEKFHSFK